jgi:hypothetical protein
VAAYRWVSPEGLRRAPGPREAGAPELTSLGLSATTTPACQTVLAATPPATPPDRGK